ncbi:uncharacterized protein LOC136042934 [Artemia franciscana]|uniref:uncharacterized protein LOC136042934 n=1 Tax=Artemia franciscana TaxID=6661 RepID=UPI0032DB455D
MLVDDSKEWNKKLYLLFIDLEKAFDLVDREMIWKILKYYGLSPKIVELIIALYKETKCCVRTENGVTRYFKIMTGVKQGCVLSPLLFTIVMDYVLRQSTGYGVTVNNKKLADLDFVDEIVLLKDAKDRLQLLFDEISENAREVRLSINVDKSKSMSRSVAPLTLQCSDKSVEPLQEFKYFSRNTGDVTFEIKRRIGQASGAFNRLTPIWRSNKYSLRLKLRLLNSNVLSILMYASECWKLNQQLEKLILGLENICLRRILKISCHQKITNREIRLKTNQPIVTEVLKKRRWTYLGHVLRMHEDRLPSRVYQ